MVHEVRGHPEGGVALGTPVLGQVERERGDSGHGGRGEQLLHHRVLRLVVGRHAHRHGSRRHRRGRGGRRKEGRHLGMHSVVLDVVDVGELIRGHRGRTRHVGVAGVELGGAVEVGHAEREVLVVASPTLEEGRRHAGGVTRE